MFSMFKPKPKPTKADRKKKDSPYCQCKYLSANRDNYRICAKCKKLIRAKDIGKVLDRLLNSVVRDIVLLRDGFCVCPAPLNGHGRKRQPGHLISRGKRSVKYDLRNVNEQCDSCNGLHENYPERYNNWYVNKFGLDAYNELCADGIKVVDLSVAELEELLNQLTEIHQKQLSEKTFKPRFSQRQILSGEWRNEQGKNPIQQSRNLEATVPAVNLTGTVVAQ